MGLIDSAVKLLETKGQAMHYTEIAKCLRASDPELGATDEIAAKKVGSALAGHVNNCGKDARVRRVVRKGSGGTRTGRYRLPSFKPKAPQISPEEVEPKKARHFLGKAGEYGVFSELLYWGFNPAMMVVDHGVDIVAEKNGTHFNLQVKTSDGKDDGSFSFSIGYARFKEHENARTFYVMVMRSNGSGARRSDYVILPSSEIRMLIDRRILNVGDKISIRVCRRNQKVLINDAHEVTGLNDFRKIR